MSLALVEGKDGFQLGASDDAAEPAIASRGAITRYEPDAEAYRPDPADDELAKLRGLVEQNAVVLDVAVTTKHGQRETFSLTETETAAWLRAEFAERVAIANRKIRERHVRVAFEAAARNIAKGNDTLALTAEEEACLREVNAVEDVRIVREGADGTPDGYVERPKLREAARDLVARSPKDVALREDFFADACGPTDAYGYLVAPTQREFLPIGGPSLEQPTISETWLTLAKCRQAYVLDPVVRHGCHILADFVLGRGVEVIAQHPAVQRVVDEFMDREKLNDRLHPLAVSLSRDGEIFERVFRQGNGRISTGELHPATIWGVVTDVEDLRIVYAYVQRYATRTQPFAPLVNRPLTKYIERIINGDDVLHVKINASQWDERGKSDIYPALGWAKRLRDYFDAAVQKEQAAASYQWHYQVQGGNADVQRITTAISGPPPPPGSNFVTNAGVDVKAVASGTNTTAKDGGTYEALLNHIAVSFGLSKDYFGAASRNSRASALIATEPSAKRFEQRQGVISSFIERLLRVVVAEAKKYGLLVAQDGEDDEIDEGFRVVFPTIITADSAARILMLRQAFGMNAISHRRMSEEIAGELELDDYDYDDEAADIKSEIGVDAWTMTMRDVAPVKRGEPDASDVAFDPALVPNPADKPATPGAPEGAGTGASYDPTSSAGRAAVAKTSKVDGQRGMTESEMAAIAARALHESGAIVIRP